MFESRRHCYCSEERVRGRGRVGSLYKLSSIS